MTFLGDELVEGGTLGIMSNGKGYTEVRHFQRPYYMLRFYFITRCYSSYMETIIADLSQHPYPDVIIINSCLWDITRSVQSYYSVLIPFDARCCHMGTAIKHPVRFQTGLSRRL